MSQSEVPARRNRLDHDARLISQSAARERIRGLGTDPRSAANCYYPARRGRFSLDHLQAHGRPPAGSPVQFSLPYLVAPLVDVVQQPVRIGGRDRAMPRGLAIAVVYVVIFFGNWVRDLFSGAAVWRSGSRVPAAGHGLLQNDHGRIGSAEPVFHAASHARGHRQGT